MAISDDACYNRKVISLYAQIYMIERGRGYGSSEIIAVTVTGAAFAAVLVPMGSDQVWNIQNFLTHAVVPAAAIADDTE